MEVFYEPYKEPLTPVEDGFGFMGALGTTNNGLKIECQVCGGLFGNLGVHAAKKHGLGIKEYKSKFRLAGNTTLVAPKIREKYVLQYQNLPSDVLVKRLENLRKGRERPHHKTWYGKSLEQKNKEGICPDQLIDKIQLLAGELGRAPTIEEYRKHYKGLVKITYDTFGSWTNAVRIAGLQPYGRGLRPYYTKSMLIDMIARFKERHGRRPYSSDLGKELPSQWTFTKNFGSFSNALKESNTV